MLREFVERKVRREIVRRNIIISGLAFIGILALWYVDSLSGLAHPFRMLVNNIHGGLTAFAMQVTGGAVDSFSLSEAGTYSILFHNGADAITMSAGYLGSAALGALDVFLGQSSAASDSADRSCHWRIHDWVSGALHPPG